MRSAAARRKIDDATGGAAVGSVVGVGDDRDLAHGFCNWRKRHVVLLAGGAGSVGRAIDEEFILRGAAAGDGEVHDRAVGEGLREDACAPERGAGQEVRVEQRIPCAKRQLLRRAFD